MPTMTKTLIVSERYCFKEQTHLTIHKTAIFFPGDGFIVYGPDGELMFRQDSYGQDPQPKDELLLLDSSGNCLLTLLRKKPSLHQRWEAFLGEKKENQSPIFEASTSSIIGPSSLVAHVHDDPGLEYHTEGSYSSRSCKVYSITPEGSSRELVAEIKRKVDPTTNVMLGKDVFWLCLEPGFDGAFAMGLVLVLDQIYGDAGPDDNKL